jgi:hypothetical protein
MKDEIMNTRMFEWSNNKCTGIAKHMDIVLLNNITTIYNKPLKKAKTIFIHTRLYHKLIIKFVNTMLDLLDHPVNLIIGGEDYTFPNNIDIRMVDKGPLPKNILDKLIQHPHIHYMFIENLDSVVKKAYPIPLGINPKTSPTTFSYYKQFCNINNSKRLVASNYNKTRNGLGQWNERQLVDTLCNTAWKSCTISTTNIKKHSEYLTSLGKTMFTLCVHGGGLDVNPKLFEALLIGVLPIIKKNPPYTNIYHELNLPVIIVDDWNINTININKLNIWKNKYYKYFTNNTLHKKLLHTLSLPFFISYVSNVN